MSNLQVKRAKILGGLIQKARIYNRRSEEECAQVLNLSVSNYAKVESGETAVSLPDLEVLALYFKIPMGYFWGSDTLPNNDQSNFKDFMALRNRVIGVMLRQFRIQGRHSVPDAAEALKVSTAVIEGYESGQSPIPYLHLEQLSKFLGVPITDFVEDSHGPLARHEMEQRLLREFHRMSPDMQAFVSKPGNISYLETAKKLSDMDVKKLRAVAEGLLDITF